jgi:hypothetical protein
MFDHLAAMMGDHGLFEHARGPTPRFEHGHCTDDNARLLVITARQADAGIPGRLGRVALAFTLAAQTADGRTHNRMDTAGRWVDEASTEDCWGRSLWAFGVAAAHHDDPLVRAAAFSAFDVGARQRSRWPRAMAFAALGAADVMTADPAHTTARELLSDAIRVIGPPLSGPWTWPEPRLTYANATLAEATLAAGAALDDPALIDNGLSMLSWLLARETRPGFVSVTGTAGSDATTTGPQFDQQPIEIAALADACWRAYTLTGLDGWSRAVLACAAWFDGANEIGAVMHDPSTGGSFDGLTPHGPNLNQGAESTLAYVSTGQRARSLTAAVS